MTAAPDQKLISAAAIDALLAAHDGDVALLYLFILRSGSRDPERAARALCRTRNEIDAALEKLGRMGLLDGESPAEPAPDPAPARQPLTPPADELPNYNAADITSRDDKVFTALVQEAQRVLGHALSTPDLKKLFGIYDYLKLPAEVIMLLLHYCVSNSKGRLPSMRYIEKEAFAWADNEILTLEQAEEHIAAQNARKTQSAAVASRLGILDRPLTPTESKYIASWLEAGFGPEAIALAYDRTVDKTGGRKWGYLNGILQSWKEHGLLTPEQIEAGDPRRRPGKSTPKSGDKPIDLGDLKSLLKTK